MLNEISEVSSNYEYCPTPIQKVKSIIVKEKKNTPYPKKYDLLQNICIKHYLRLI